MSHQDVEFAKWQGGVDEKLKNIEDNVQKIYDSLDENQKNLDKKINSLFKRCETIHKGLNTEVITMKNKVKNNSVFVNRFKEKNKSVDMKWIGFKFTAFGIVLSFVLNVISNYLKLRF